MLFRSLHNFIKYQFARFLHNNPVNIIDLSAAKVNLEPLFCKQCFRDTKALLVGAPNPHRTLPAASGCASASDALTAVPDKEKPGCFPSRLQRNISLICLLFIVIIGKNLIQRNRFHAGNHICFQLFVGIIQH